MKKLSKLFFLFFILAAVFLPSVYFGCQNNFSGDYFSQAGLYCPISQFNKAPSDYLVFVEKLNDVNLPYLFLLGLFFVYLSAVYFSDETKKLLFILSLYLLNIRSSMKLALARGLINSKLGEC